MFLLQECDLKEDCECRAKRFDPLIRSDQKCAMAFFSLFITQLI